MTEPLAPQNLPGFPPPPPEINRKRLWLSLLLPSGVMVAMMIILIFAINGGSGGEILLTVICAAACIATIVGWVLFIQTMRQRFRGSSLVLLILAYPIVQAVLLFSIFFVGCLAAVWSDGIH